VERFQNENTVRYTKLIAITEGDPSRDEARYQTLLRLLAEERAKLSGSIPMREQTASGIRKPIPYRICDNCNRAMTHLSDLPSFMGAAPVTVFRCNLCNHVVAENRLP
jgi:hypothetical protein